MLISGQAGAANPQSHAPSLNQMQHTAWKAADGAPESISAIAQSPDGYLWLGTHMGLFAFDGSTFKQLHRVDDEQTNPVDILSLITTPNGALWIGERSGRVIQLQGKQVIRYSSAEGLPHADVEILLCSPEGSILALTTAGVSCLHQGRWIDRYNGVALPRVSANGRFDDNGNLWLHTESSGNFFLPVGGSVFLRGAPEEPGDSSLAQSPISGDMWESTKRSIRLSIFSVKHRRSSPPPLVRGHWPLSPFLMFTRSGDLWVSAFREGVSWIRADAFTRASLQKGAVEKQTFTESDGLTSDLTITMFEDREGTVWVATSRGLDRFKPGPMLRVSLESHTSNFAVQPNPAGGVWIAPNSGHLISSSAFQDHPLFIRSPDFITALHTDNAGVLWVGTVNGIFRNKGGRWLKLPNLPGMDSVTPISLVHDSEGNLWVSFRDRGLYKWDGQQWSRYRGIHGLPNEVSGVLYLARDRCLWIGYPHGTVAKVSRQSVSMLTLGNGSSVGDVTSFAEDDIGVWIGANQGLFRVTASSIQSFSLDNSRLLWRIVGVQPTSSGDLWLNAGSGILRIPARELTLAVSNPTHKLRAEQFGIADGVNGINAYPRFGASIAVADGRLWFSNHFGVFRVDPGHVPARPPVTPPLIEQVVVNGQAVPAPPLITLEPKTRNLEISYTSINLSEGEQLQFRYKLEGLDSEWQQVNRRRRAFYTDCRLADTGSMSPQATEMESGWRMQPSRISLYNPPSSRPGGSVPDSLSSC